MPRPSQDHAGRTFLALHEAPRGFFLPNVWDAGSAVVLAAEGFPALATTSAGIAFSLGRQDYQVSDPRLALSRTEMFVRLDEIVRSVDVPVNGDLEAGWGDASADVAQTIGMAIDVGLAGGNIEDKIPGVDELYDEALAVERIAAAAEAIRRRGTTFVLNARTDALQSRSPDALATCIRRANLFLAAGADCVFTPGAGDLETIRTLVAEIEGPLNIVVGLAGAPTDARAILAAGVRRISLGGSIARSALSFVRRSARELRDRGSIAFADDQIAGSELNRLFAEAAGRRDARPPTTTDLKP
jgi:2-methylisocitrate lyase-like PEP mutase family enzyme